MEPKKLALLRILQILREESDERTPLTQSEIVAKLASDYGISIERKAVGRNLSLLREAGYDIVSEREGCYLHDRMFEDSELRLLIDSVLASKHIPVTQSRDLARRLCALSGKHFRSGIKHICAASEWNKSLNSSLFYNIDVIDEAIEKKRQIEYDYNKYGADKKLHMTSHQIGSPYQMILHNQHYYLMSLNEKHKTIMYCRVDRITNIRLTDVAVTALKTVPGFENGIDYRRFSSAMPYMFADTPVPVEFLTEERMLDQVVDWFGFDAFVEPDGDRFRVRVSVSPTAMLYWSLQYASAVEVISPVSLREKLHETLMQATGKYAPAPTLDAQPS